MNNLPVPVSYTKYSPRMPDGFSIEPLEMKQVHYFDIEKSLVDIQLGVGFVICKGDLYLGSVEVWDIDGDAIMSAFITDDFRKFPIFLTRCLIQIARNLHSIGYKKIKTPGEAQSFKWLSRFGFTEKETLHSTTETLEVYVKCHS